VACSPGGGSTTETPTASPQDLRVASPFTHGSADLLCAEVMLAAGFGAHAELHAASPLADAALAERLEHAALDHLRSVAMGAGNGAELAGSRRIRRLALLPGAPPDLNQNGQNWDETLLAERTRIATTAGAAPLPGSWQTFLPWQYGSSALAQPLLDSASSHPANWRTTANAGQSRVSLRDVGAAMTARALAVGHLLRTSRGPLAGSDSEKGRLGLDLLHQLLATEETLIGSLFTAGGALGELPDPSQYDPALEARWLPAEFAIDLDPGLPGAPAAYRTVDGSNDLLALARLLRGTAELTSLASDDNPQPNLRALFRGHPFEEAPPPPPPGPSWDIEIRALIAQRCASCHDFGIGFFWTNTYESMLQGGLNTQAQNLPMVVPGDHASSMLWRMVTSPPPGFNRMPPTPNDPLPQPEIDLIAEWIDQGAPEHPVAIPPPPRPGEVMATVLFRNLVALHLDLDTGALHHRFDGAQGSNIATATATGATLDALAVLAKIWPELEYGGMRVTDVLLLTAEFAGANLLDLQGRAFDDFDIARRRPGLPAHLDGQAALTAGLLAAAPFAPLNATITAAAEKAALRLLGPFWQPTSDMFREAEANQGGRYEAPVLADVMTALRLAAAWRDTLGADSTREALLRRLLPLLIPSEWDHNGEILDDGIADTDGNGVPEPAAAGGTHGQLPVFGRTILLGNQQQRPANERITWTAHVRPLFWQKCGNCHMNGNALGGYRLDTVPLAKTAGDSGGLLELIRPGSPEDSLLYRKLVDRSPALGQQMPIQQTPLDAGAVEIVRRWILQGASAR